MIERPKRLLAHDAAAVLRTALRDVRGELTVADAAARSGLALTDAQLGLFHLSSEVESSLAATAQGELLFRFPKGVAVPLTKRTGWIRFWDRATDVVVGAAKFVVRAWLTIAMLGYVAVFVALALALAFSGRDDEKGAGSNILGALFRVMFEAVYWTFHPFSPVHAIADARSRSRPRDKQLPFYQRVNQFVFGPERTRPDQQDTMRKLLVQVRAGQGRIGVSDVMRVTGASLPDANALIAKLMLDHDGDVHVSDDGGISYSFPALMKSVETVAARPVSPVWNDKVTAAPITGNSATNNLLIGALNGFNLFASTLVLMAGLTVDKLAWIFQQAQTRLPLSPPPDGIPWLLGVIPFVMSLSLFALPAWRALTHRRKQRAAQTENGRRAVLRTVLEESARNNAVHEEKLQRAWQAATGVAPSEQELTTAVVALGGDVDLKEAESSGRAAYRFVDLEAEVNALRAQRETVSADEREVGEVVYRSDH